MVIGLDCAEPDLVFNRWLTKSAAYEAGPDQNPQEGHKPVHPGLPSLVSAL